MRPANGTKQHRIGSHRIGKRLICQRGAMRVIGSTADKPFLHVKADRFVLRQPIDDPHVGLHDFGADAVARQHHDLTVRRHFAHPCLDIIVVVRPGSEPGLVVGAGRLETVDRGALFHGQPDIIKALQKTFLAERINLK